jgi:phosphoserine phosphatase
MKLAVFDFDSTLMDGETIDEFAKELGLKEKVASITEMAMAGELDFFESLIMRVKLLEGLEEKKVIEIAHSLPYMPGAKETITEMKKWDILLFVLVEDLELLQAMQKIYLDLMQIFQMFYMLKMES